MKQVWLLALVAAFGMTACATAVDEPTDEAVTPEEVVDTVQEDLESVECHGIWICTDSFCVCIGISHSKDAEVAP